MVRKFACIKKIVSLSFREIFSDNSCYIINICILVNHLSSLCIQVSNCHLNSAGLTFFIIVSIFIFIFINPSARLLTWLDDKLAINLALSINVICKIWFL